MHCSSFYRRYTFFITILLQCYLLELVICHNNNNNDIYSYNNNRLRRVNKLFYKNKQDMRNYNHISPQQKEQKYVHKGEFSLLETHVAPATINTRDDPDAMQLPLKKYTCGCYLSKPRIEVTSFFESFEYIEEYEEQGNGNMAMNKLKDDPPLLPIVKPDYLECNCHHIDPHIAKKLQGQGEDA